MPARSPVECRHPAAARVFAARNRRATLGRVLSRCVLAAAVVTPLGGCQIVIGVLMLLRGNPMIDADFKQQTGLEMTEKGKKVVVLCTSPDKAKSNHSSLDVDLITEVSRRLKQEKIKIVDEHKVATWLDDRGGVVDDEAIGELARKFKADYVILLEIDEFSIREENSTDLYRGRTRGTASVFSRRKGAKGTELSSMKRIYNKEIASVYPVHHPVQSDAVSEVSFKKQYLDRVSDDIGRMFHDHRPGEEF
jgi:hypothetical protein